MCPKCVPFLQILESPLFIAIFIDLCHTELSVSVFYSFETGMATYATISNFKSRKIFLPLKNLHFPSLIICLTEHQSQHILSISVEFHVL